MKLRYRNGHVQATRNIRTRRREVAKEVAADFDINHRVDLLALHNPTIAMAPKRYQSAKSGDTGTSKTSDKEELVKARAIKRIERVKARFEEAEKHKEVVRTLRPLLFRIT